MQGFFYEYDRFILLQKMWNLAFLLLCFVGNLGFSNVYGEEAIKIATASNFLLPMKNLKKHFESELGVDVILISGSTSKLYAQIINGAPYDIFLSADQNTVGKLIENGLAIKNSEFVYATGKLALWRRGHKRSTSELQNDLVNLRFKRLAIANPKLAPYGHAALEVLHNLALYDKVSARLVYGENIGQAFQFAYSGNAELGMVAVSQLKSLNNAGQYWEIPLDLYQPLKQSAVLLKRAKNNIAAKLFMTLLKSRKIQQVISREFGYLSATTKTLPVR